MWTATIAALTLGIVAASSGKKKAALRDALRRINRRWFNPQMLRLAGRAPWPVARLEHRGRRSGALRVTPVLGWPVAGGFIVPMPYGTDVDWASNLLRAGEGVLQYQGVRHRIGNPRVVLTREVLDDVPVLLGVFSSAVGLRHVLRADVLPSVTPEVAPPA